MNNPILTLPLLNRFLGLLKFSFEGYTIIEDEDILELIKFIDKEEKFWHVEGKRLYTKKEWLKDIAKKERDRIENEKIQEIRDVRLKTIRSLQYKLAEEFGLEKDNEEIIKIAVNILKSGKTKLASILDVDISNIPDMPINYWVLDGKIEIKL